MNIIEIAKEVSFNYPKGIYIWQLQKESKYFGVDSNDLLRALIYLRGKNVTEYLE